MRDELYGACKACNMWCDLTHELYMELEVFSPRRTRPSVRHQTSKRRSAGKWERGAGRERGNAGARVRGRAGGGHAGVRACGSGEVCARECARERERGLTGAQGPCEIALLYNLCYHVFLFV